jgi:neutral amino acid transport system ATP-binding protein
LSRRLLEVDQVVKRFGGITAVANATLDVEEGSITSLIGPNGAGKTTLFNLIAGVYRAEHGDVRFAGEKISGKRPHRVAGAGLVRTFQHARALTRMSVFENMLLAGARQPGEHIARVVATPRAWRRREREVEAQAAELLALVRLDHLSGAYAGTLSGGQRKLVALARALVTKPRLVLLDEPSAGLSPLAMDTVFDKLVEISALGIGIVMVEQNARRALALAHRGYVLDTGRNAIAGTGAELLRDPKVAELYLGGAAISP